MYKNTVIRAKNTVIRARVSEYEKEKFEILAASMDLTVSELIRNTLNKKFMEIFPETEIESEDDFVTAWIKEEMKGE